MKRLIFLLLLVACLTLSACKQVDEAAEKILNDSRTATFGDEVYLPFTYNISELFIEASHISAPTGVLIYDEKIFICDKTENCVFIFNEQGDFLEKIGKTGNGNSQFIQPRQICVSNELYYVLDSGNHRIQVFDKEFHFQSEYQLNKLVDDATEFYYSDMAIDEGGNMYVSTFSVDPQDTKITKITPQNVRMQIGDELIGYLHEVEGKIYFVNYRKILRVEENGSLRIYHLEYENYLYQLEKDQLKVVKELPFKYSPVNFNSGEETLVMYSDKFYTLDIFGKDGAYGETIYQFASDPRIEYLAYDEEKEYVIATSPITGKIYRIQKHVE